MLEVKGQLAKLLAQEDLIVEHRQVETAQFDVERRVLTLPLWEKASNEVLDMLIAHEVGHALYTPNTWDHVGSVPQSYVNVAEDIRIEKLMKRRYAGLPKTFRKGYEKFAAEDFFQLEGQDLNKFSLADRLNIFFKIGHFIDVPFTEEEETYKLTGWDLETFEEVLQYAKDLYTYDRKQRENQPSQTPTDSQEPNGNLQSDEVPPTQQSSDESNTETTEEGDQDGSKTESESQDLNHDEGAADEGGHRGGEGHVEDLEAKTDSTLSESIQELVDSSAPVINYVQIPELDLKQIIASSEEVHKCLENYWKEFFPNSDTFDRVNEAYSQYKINSNREVNYLVKEFECRKAASSHARSSVSRTGVLDTTKLHTYKYNDDIFRKIRITADGKNHGLIFNLDWSGSMQMILHDTVKQLLNLVAFCRKVKIPFEVYAFTNEWEPGENCWYKNPKKEGDIRIAGFNLLNLITSKAKTKDIDRACRNLFRMSHAIRHHSRYGIPNRLYLSGTPLNEAIIAMKQVIPQFQNTNKVEKVHVINLTDGEGSGIQRWGNARHSWDIESLGIRSDDDKLFPRDIHGCQLRDRKIGRIYPAFNHRQCYYGDSSPWVQNLRDNFPQASIISIRLISGNDWSRVQTKQTWEDRQKSQVEWKKHRSYIDQTSAYTRSLYIHSNTFDETKNEFEVKEDAKKGDITRAFKKSLKNKKSSKRILNEFIALIA